MLLRLFVVGLLLLSGCSARTPAKPTIVAGFYPIAWLAEQIAPPGTEVVDLTPAGAEAHDISLTATQRAAVASADVVLMVGRDFQPDLARASADARGVVVDLLDQIDLMPSAEGTADPHVWLDPLSMVSMIDGVRDAIAKAFPAATDVEARADATAEALKGLDATFRTTLATCSLRTLATTHDAFGYLARRYDLTRLSLTGVTPDAEPTSTAIGGLTDAARAGRITTLFAEASDEGRRLAASIANDLGLTVRTLHTLESAPDGLTYVSQMEQNLAALKDGLRCR